jgi:hypothetical protein
MNAWGYLLSRTITGYRTTRTVNASCWTTCPPQAGDPSHWLRDYMGGEEEKKKLLSSDNYDVSLFFLDINILILSPPILKIPILNYVSTHFTIGREIDRQIKEFKLNLTLHFLYAVPLRIAGFPRSSIPLTSLSGSSIRNSCSYSLKGSRNRMLCTTISSFPSTHLKT